jgi:hypothetical protein
MTFEEFFNKKRIDLVALKAAEPGLFAEFEKHFAQMGEKSFDHTKKYWFNKLRLQYHLAPEQKPEKMHLENRLAEQTIVETLTESIPAASAGFKPRFKPGMASKPASPTSDVKTPAPQDGATITPEVNEAAATKDQNPPFEQEKAAMQELADSMPRTTDTEQEKVELPASKPGFKPRFSMKMTKGDDPQTKEFEKIPDPDTEATEPASPTETAAPKPGFKPRFNMNMAAPKTGEAEGAKAKEALEKETTPPSEVTVPKPGFKPRFNMKNMTAKPAEDVTEQKEEVEPPVTEEKPATDLSAEEAPSAPKPGFKPRFNMKMVAPKPDSEEAGPEQSATEATPAEEEKPAPADEAPVVPKIGFKPRFNAKTTKPQQPPEE